MKAITPIPKCSKCHKKLTAGDVAFWQTICSRCNNKVNAEIYELIKDNLPRIKDKIINL